MRVGPFRTKCLCLLAAIAFWLVSGPWPLLLTPFSDYFPWPTISQTEYRSSSLLPLTTFTLRR